MVDQNESQNEADVHYLKGTKVTPETDRVRDEGEVNFSLEREMWNEGVNERVRVEIEGSQMAVTEMIPSAVVALQRTMQDAIHTAALMARNATDHEQT